MLVLPGGRIIDLSFNRCKHHALRNRGVGPTSTHRKLYSLIDIIYRFSNENGKPNRGWTEYDYEYSGYTLDTVRMAVDWDDAEKDALFIWAGQAEQKRTIESARRRLVNEQQQLAVKHYSAPQHLYSLLQQYLLTLPLQRATAKQWLSTINNKKQYGLREEEIQWSGLKEYLIHQKHFSPISKKTLLENLNFRNIRIELTTEQIWGAHGGLSFKEVAHRMPHQAVYRAALKLDDDCLCILRYVDTVCNYRVGVVKTLNNTHHMSLNKYWFVLDSYGRAVINRGAISNNSELINHHLFFENSAEAKFAADKHAREHFGVRSGAKTHTNFDHLTLYGGYDSREWIVSLPDYQRTFFGAHFYDHNILSHIRTTTRTDTDGRKILFIEEIQSDWHQSGKRFGYDNNPWGKVANAPFKQEWPILAVKLMLIQAGQNGFAGIAWPFGEVQEKRYGCQLESIKQIYDSIIPKALNRMGKKFNSEVVTTCIHSRDPWLSIEKKEDKWCVADGEGKFKTKAKYHNRDEAMAVIARHSRAIELEVQAFFISEKLRRQISDKGLPLFGIFIN